MPEVIPRTLNHFSLHAFNAACLVLSAAERAALGRDWLMGLRSAAASVQLYQPTESGLDLIAWSALPVEAPEAPAHFLECYAKANNPHRPYLRPFHALWGFTRPSKYTPRPARRRRWTSSQRRASATW
jgi:hypothetical protein